MAILEFQGLNFFQKFKIIQFLHFNKITPICPLFLGIFPANLHRNLRSPKNGVLVQFSITVKNLPKVAQIRRKTLEAFCNILTKHNLDNRYNTQKDQSRIAQLFAPFIGFLTRHFLHLNIDMVEATSAFVRNPSIRSNTTNIVTETLTIG